MGVDAHAGPAGQAQSADAARPRGEAVRRVLGVDAVFDGVAADLGGPVLAEGQAFPGGQADLERHEVESGHALGHRVLDL